MSHNCTSLLCDTPHYANDDHPGDCLCELCHDHFEDWDAYTYSTLDGSCEGCLNAMSQWIHENTDLEGCQFPELCTYKKTCRMNSGGNHE